MSSNAQFVDASGSEPKRLDRKSLFSFFSDSFGRSRGGFDENALKPVIARHLADVGRRGSRAKAPTAEHVVTFNDVEAVVDHALRDDGDGILAVVDDVMERGAPWIEIALHLFQPAFRELGAFWTRDERNFVEVGLAATTLQTAYRLASLADDAHEAADVSDRCALLVRLNSDRHTSGTLIIADLMRKAGWQVNEVDRRDDAVGDYVASTWCDLVCVAVGQKQDLTFLEKTIGEVRRMSRNPGIAVLAGGPAFVNHPDLCSKTAADAVALDGRDALGRADALWAERGSRMVSVKRG